MKLQELKYYSLFKKMQFNIKFFMDNKNIFIKSLLKTTYI